MIEIKNCSDWYFIITGNTRQYKYELQELGGVWSSRDNEWTFTIDKLNIIKNFFNKENIKYNNISFTDSELLKKKDTEIIKDKVIKNINDTKNLINFETIQDIIFEDFCQYLSTKIDKKNIDIILDSYIKNIYFNYHDFTDGYFDNELIKLTKFFYNFINDVSYFIPHSIYQQIDIKKMIEHALITIKKNNL